MKTIAWAFTGFILFSTSVLAAEFMDADAVRKLLTGNTVHGLRASGDTVKNYFSPDGKLYRLEGDKTAEGTWQINDDGMQCVAGLTGGCARIKRNDDGSYDRVLPNGKVLLKWTSVTSGKDF